MIYVKICKCSIVQDLKEKSACFCVWVLDLYAETILQTNQNFTENPFGFREILFVFWMKRYFFIKIN